MFEIECLPQCHLALSAELHLQETDMECAGGDRQRGTVVQAGGNMHTIKCALEFKAPSGCHFANACARQRCGLFYHTEPCCHEGGIRGFPLPPILSPHIITVIHQALLPCCILSVPTLRSRLCPASRRASEG